MLTLVLQLYPSEAQHAVLVETLHAFNGAAADIARCPAKCRGEPGFLVCHPMFIQTEGQVLWHHRQLLQHPGVRYSASATVPRSPCGMPSHSLSQSDLFSLQHSSPS